jgi:hypothetical protein
MTPHLNVAWTVAAEQHADTRPLDHTTGGHNWGAQLMTAAHRIYIQPTLKSDGTPKVAEKGPLYDEIFQGDHICTVTNRFLMARGSFMTAG